MVLRQNSQNAGSPSQLGGQSTNKDDKYIEEARQSAQDIMGRGKKESRAYQPCGGGVNTGKDKHKERSNFEKGETGNPR